MNPAPLLRVHIVRAIKVAAAVPVLFNVPPPPARVVLHCGEKRRGTKGVETGAVQLANSRFSARQIVLQKQTGRAPAVARHIVQVFARKEHGIDPSNGHEPVQVATQRKHSVDLLFHSGMRVVAHLLDVAFHLGGVASAKLPQV